MYYYGIKGPNPLIFGRKKRHVIDIIQTELVPLVE
jgi:hypothetical protein